MRIRSFVASVLVVGCGGAPPPQPVTVAPRAILPAPVDTAPVKVDAPRDLVAWMHVEHPARLAALIDRVSGPAAADASCASGDVRACLELADAERPMDVAVTLSESGDDAEAIAFSVRGLDAFKTRASASFEVQDTRAGRLRLVDKTKKKATPVECDASRADSPAHRVVCGEAPGVERLGAWLASSPEPPSREGLARLEIYRRPIVAAADKHWAGDTDKDRSARALAHDFEGATLQLDAGEDPAARAELALEVRMRDSKSPWTQALLAPTSSASLPPTFARLVPDSTGALYVPGGAPLVALVDRFGELDAVSAFAGKPVADELRATLARPIACGYVVDLDDGRAALANLRRAPAKDREKAHTALDAALSGHATCAVQEPAKSIEHLVRELVQAAPKTGDHYAVRSATSLGLPAKSFLIEATRAPKPGAKGPSKDTTLAVPDGDTTWIVLANDASDVPRAVRSIKRVLAKPAGSTDALAATPGALVTGYATTLFGAFFWDLAMRSYDEIEKTLAIKTPERLDIALTQKVAGAGGTVSLHLSTRVGALPALAAHAGQLAMPLGLLAAVWFADSSSSKP